MNEYDDNDSDNEKEKVLIKSSRTTKSPVSNTSFPMSLLPVAQYYPCVSTQFDPLPVYCTKLI